MKLNLKLDCAKIEDDRNDYEIPKKSVVVYYSYIDSDLQTNKRQKAKVKLDKLIKSYLLKKESEEHE